MTRTRSCEVSSASPSAAIMGSRFSRSLYVGRHRTARGIAVSSRDAQDVAPQRRAGGSARPPGRPLGDPRGGVVQGHRVSARGGRIRESPLPIAELALDGKAKELPGIGKTIESKVVEVVEDGEMHALTKRRELVPDGVVDFLRLPGVGPKTAARIWTQLGITSLDGLKTAAEAGRLRDLSGMGARSEEKILKALEAGVGDKTEERRLLADGAAGGATCRRRAASAPGGDRGVGGGKRPPPSRDGARSRSHRDLERRAGAHRGVLQRRLGRRSRGARRDEGDSRRARRPSLRSPCRAGGVLRQRAPALHRLEGSQHRAAGGRAAPRAVDLGVRRHDRRDRRGRHARERGRALRVPRVPHAGARAARGDGRDRGCARRRASRSRRGR